MSIVAIYAGIAGFVYVCFIAGIAVAVLRNTKDPGNGYAQQRDQPVFPGRPPPVNGSSRGETALGAAAAATATATAAAVSIDNEQDQKIPGTETADTELGAAAAAAAAVASMTPTAKDGTDNNYRNARLEDEHNSKEEANIEIGAAAAVAATASLANVEEGEEERVNIGVDDDGLSTASASQVHVDTGAQRFPPNWHQGLAGNIQVSTEQFKGPPVPQGGGATVAGAGALSAFLPHYVIKIVRLLVWRKAMKQDNGASTLRLRTFLTDALLTFVAIAALDILRPPGVDDRFVVDAVLDYVLSIALIVAYSLISIRHALEVHILNALIVMPYFLIKTAF